jgi:hypothetical protein
MLDGAGAFHSQEIQFKQGTLFLRRRAGPRLGVVMVFLQVARGIGVRLRIGISLE